MFLRPLANQNHSKILCLTRQLEFRKHGDAWTVEYSEKELLNVLTAIEAVLLEYSCTDVNALELLLNIHGARTYGLQLPVTYDGHANWVREKSMLADLLAAVFSVRDNKSQEGRLVHLVLTERSFSRISPTNGEAWTILEFAEECANVQPAPSLCRNQEPRAKQPEKNRVHWNPLVDVSAVCFECRLIDAILR
jgi:hypothetical protein